MNFVLYSCFALPLGAALYTLYFTVIDFTWDKRIQCMDCHQQRYSGPVLESGSFDALLERVRFAVPELLELSANAILKQSGIGFKF